MKKIDTEKSVIFGRSKSSIKESFEHLNKEGYFSDFKDFSDCKEGILKSILLDNDICYPYEDKYDGNRYYYFIPKDKAEFIVDAPKQYRPYTKHYDFPFYVGDVLKIRVKNDKSTTYFLINSITYNENREIEFIGIGSREATAKYWFDSIEICINDKWQPFGVEE